MALLDARRRPQHVTGDDRTRQRDRGDPAAPVGGERPGQNQENGGEQQGVGDEVVDGKSENCDDEKQGRQTPHNDPRSHYDTIPGKFTDATPGRARSTRDMAPSQWPLVSMASRPANCEMDDTVDGGRFVEGSARRLIGNSRTGVRVRAFDVPPAMKIASAVDGAAGLNRLLDALSDPKRSGRTVAIALVLYCAVWTLYAVLSKLSQDIHFDMGEMVSWSREVGLGTPKHPPLPAWLVGIWFIVFPLQDWAFYLLSMAMATFALWVAWMIAGRYLDGEKRAAGLALLTLVPFFNFHALKYNANSMLTPTWALTTWFFLRSLDSRSAGAAVLAGLAAAVAMLVKYWSVVLLAGLAIAALADSRRAALFPLAGPLHHRRRRRGGAGAPYLVALCP